MKGWHKDALGAGSFAVAFGLLVVLASWLFFGFDGSEDDVILTSAVVYFLAHRAGREHA